MISYHKKNIANVYYANHLIKDVWLGRKKIFSSTDWKMDFIPLGADEYTGFYLLLDGKLLRIKGDGAHVIEDDVSDFFFFGSFDISSGVPRLLFIRNGLLYEKSWHSESLEFFSSPSGNWQKINFVNTHGTAFSGIRNGKLYGKTMYNYVVESSFDVLKVFYAGGKIYALSCYGDVYSYPNEVKILSDVCDIHVISESNRYLLFYLKHDGRIGCYDTDSIFLTATDSGRVRFSGNNILCDGFIFNAVDFTRSPIGGFSNIGGNLALKDGSLFIVSDILNPVELSNSPEDISEIKSNCFKTASGGFWMFVPYADPSMAEIYNLEWPIIYDN